MRFVYPNGLRKALTFSYDDGQVYDKQLAKLFRDHGMKATFHLNSAMMGLQENEIFVNKNEVKSVYEGHEIACHGMQHRNPTTITKQQYVLEVQEDRKMLEKVTGAMVQGMSYAYGNYNDDNIKIAKDLGIKYSRTINDTMGFFPPDDFMQWHPTCHHNHGLKEMGERFINVHSFYELPLMYVWGHSFEFERDGSWQLMEDFVKRMEEQTDIWFATNMEIYTYINATRQLEFSADGLTVYNPSVVSVWIEVRSGLFEVKPGETQYVGEH